MACCNSHSTQLKQLYFPCWEVPSSFLGYCPLHHVKKKNKVIKVFKRTMHTGLVCLWCVPYTAMNFRVKQDMAIQDTSGGLDMQLTWKQTRNAYRNLARKLLQSLRKRWKNIIKIIKWILRKKCYNKLKRLRWAGQVSWGGRDMKCLQNCGRVTIWKTENEVGGQYGNGLKRG